ncbi:hypothetical protein HQ560_11065 [bacterium]|nr:hypothetical protein [bacterium]
MWSPEPRGNGAIHIRRSRDLLHWDYVGQVFDEIPAWPRADAPGGAWLDPCIMGQDGTCYVGRNQRDLLIRGVRPRQE